MSGPGATRGAAEEAPESNPFAEAGTALVLVGSTDGALRAFALNPEDGSLLPAGEVDVGDDLDFVALGPDDRTAFVSARNRVMAFEYDPGVQAFSPRASQPTAGKGTHVSVDPTGSQVVVSHYDVGAISHLQYREGTLSAARTLEPGANAHQARFSEDGTRLYVPCLGSNHVALYDLDPTEGRLAPATPPRVPAPGGPRHMDLHPSQPRAYVLAELESQVHVFDVDAAGTLVPRPADSAFTSDAGPDHWSSDVHVTPDGRHLYAINRRPPEIVRFRVEESGSVTRLGADELSAVTRSFAIDPSGEYLLAGGRDGVLVSRRIDPASGNLAASSRTTDLGSIHAIVVRRLASPVAAKP